MRTGRSVEDEAAPPGERPRLGAAGGGRTEGADDGRSLPNQLCFHFHILVEPASATLHAEPGPGEELEHLRSSHRAKGCGDLQGLTEDANIGNDSLSVPLIIGEGIDGLFP